MRPPVLVTPPADLPVSVDALKTYGRIDGSDDDTLVHDLIEAAADLVEKFTGRALMLRTMRQVLDGLTSYSSDEWWDGVQQGAIGSLMGAPIVVPLTPAPLSSITGIVTYDAAGAATTVPPTSYVIDGSTVRLTAALPANVRPSAGVEVTYVAGYPSASAIPPALRMAVKVQALRMYEQRDCVDLCDGAMALAQPYRIFNGL